MAQTGSKRTRAPSTQVKFVINIPFKVDTEDQAKNRCGALLSALKGGFTEEDTCKFRKQGKLVLEDIAVIFGMNGKHTPELPHMLERLEKFFMESCNWDHVKYSVITYTWGDGGTIAQDTSEVPYQDIREHLKKHPKTTKLVEDFRQSDPTCLVYFSFVDSDTFSFNSIYSEYLQIVKEELEKDNIPPTVMSTGYEFTHEKQYHIPSWFDLELRQAVAEVEPLLVYYPEPNFCVLVGNGLNTIEESFIKPKRGKKEKRHYESPVLVSQVKKRPNFKAMFPPAKKPIIIVAPERFSPTHHGLKIGQSTLDGLNLAKSILCNGVFTNKQTYTKGNQPNLDERKKGVAGINRGFIAELFNCEDDKKFDELSKKNPFSCTDGGDPAVLIEAVRAAREYRMWVYEMEKKIDSIGF